MNTWLVLSKLMGIVRRGFLKELEVSDFLWSRFLIIKQNVNMATNAILNSGLTPEATAVRRTMPPHCACRCYCLPFFKNIDVVIISASAIFRSGDVVCLIALRDLHYMNDDR